MDKTIHYCWFGKNKKPKIVKFCIKSWKKYAKDFKIIEWNESNVDILSLPLFVQKAYEQKKWAFVSDYVRLKVVYENGGIYLDTDVQLVKPLSELTTFVKDYKSYFGVEKDSFKVNTGLGFGAEKGAKILKDIMAVYENENLTFDINNMVPLMCPVLNAPVFIEYGFNKQDQFQVINDNTLILDSEYLSPTSFRDGNPIVTSKTFSIHHFKATWHNKEQRKQKLKYWRTVKMRKVKHALAKPFNKLFIKLLGEEKMYNYKVKLDRKLTGYKPEQDKKSKEE